MIALLVLGIILGVLAAVIPMDATVRKLVVAAAAILVILAILFMLGLLPLDRDRVDRPVVEHPVIVH